MVALCAKEYIGLHPVALKENGTLPLYNDTHDSTGSSFTTDLECEDEAEDIDRVIGCVGCFTPTQIC